MQEGKNNIVCKVKELVKPIIANFDLELWDIEFVKEGSEYYLRVYIDKPTGVDINDCEKVSKAIDKPLDELDPIDIPYNLEVSSPGVERRLKKPEHFLRCIGYDVKIKLIRPDESKNREYIARLKEFSNDQLVVETDENIQMVFNLKDIAYVKLNDFKNY